MELKQCGRCYESKPEPAFTPSQWRFTRGRPWCRDCSHAYYQARRDGHALRPSNRPHPNCLLCGKSNVGRMAQAQYCSRACSGKASAAKWRHKNRGYSREHRYGLDADTHALLLREQGNVCAICRTDDPGPYTWNVDHCHETGEVRGLLCSHCNTGLGRFRDDPTILRSAIEYLANPPARGVLDVAG